MIIKMVHPSVYVKSLKPDQIRYETKYIPTSMVVEVVKGDFLPDLGNITGQTDEQFYAPHTFYLYKGAGYDPKQKMPMVVIWHWCDYKQQYIYTITNWTVYLLNDEGKTVDRL